MQKECIVLFSKAQAQPKQPNDKEKSSYAEIKLSGWLAEHNIPFTVMDHLIDVLKDAFPDSKVSNRFC